MSQPHSLLINGSHSIFNTLFISKQIISIIALWSLEDWVILKKSGMLGLITCNRCFCRCYIDDFGYFSGNKVEDRIYCAFQRSACSSISSNPHKHHLIFSLYFCCILILTVSHPRENPLPTAYPCFFLVGGFIRRVRGIGTTDHQFPVFNFFSCLCGGVFPNLSCIFYFNLVSVFLT